MNALQEKHTHQNQLQDKINELAEQIVQLTTKVIQCESKLPLVKMNRTQIDLHSQMLQDIIKITQIQESNRKHAQNLKIDSSKDIDHQRRKASIRLTENFIRLQSKQTLDKEEIKQNRMTTLERIDSFLKKSSQARMSNVILEDQIHQLDHFYGIQGTTRSQNSFENSAITSVLSNKKGEALQTKQSDPRLQENSNTNSRMNEFTVLSRERMKSSEDHGSRNPATPGLLEKSIKTPESKQSQMETIQEKPATQLSNEHKEQPTGEGEAERKVIPLTQVQKEIASGSRGRSSTTYVAKENNMSIGSDESKPQLRETSQKSYTTQKLKSQLTLQADQIQANSQTSIEKKLETERKSDILPKKEIKLENARKIEDTESSQGPHDLQPVLKESPKPKSNTKQTLKPINEGLEFAKREKLVIVNEHQIVEKLVEHHHHHKLETMQASPQPKMYQFRNQSSDHNASYSNDQLGSDLDNSRLQEQIYQQLNKKKLANLQEDMEMVKARLSELLASHRPKNKQTVNVNFDYVSSKDFYASTHKLQSEINEVKKKVVQMHNGCK